MTMGPDSDPGVWEPQALGTVSTMGTHVRCKRRTTFRELEYHGRVKCPNYGYRVLKKTSPAVKRLKGV